MTRFERLSTIGEDNLNNYLKTSYQAAGHDHARPVYSIGAVARMLDIPTATLRTWQDRYAVVVPERSEGGHRLYTRDQVEQLRFVADQVASGLSPADAHRVLRERLTAGQPVSAPPTSTRDKLLILLAERDPFAAEFAEYFLRTEGYDVSLALSAEDAAAAADGASPDLAVIELLISSGQGLELCQRLGDRLPVLAISTVELRDRAIAAGASAFLRKPIEPLQLVSVVRDLLGRSAYLRAHAATGREGPTP